MSWRGRAGGRAYMRIVVELQRGDAGRQVLENRLISTCDSCGAAVFGGVFKGKVAGSRPGGGKGASGASGLPRACLGSSLGAAWERRRRYLFRGLKGRGVAAGSAL